MTTRVVPSCTVQPGTLQYDACHAADRQRLAQAERALAEWQREHRIERVVTPVGDCSAPCAIEGCRYADLHARLTACAEVLRRARLQAFDRLDIVVAFSQEDWQQVAALLATLPPERPQTEGK